MAIAVQKKWLLKRLRVFWKCILIPAFGIFYGDSISITQSGETGESSSDRGTNELGFGTQRSDDDRAIDG